MGWFRDNSESDNFRRRYDYAATTPVPAVVTWPELTFRALARETSERVRARLSCSLLEAIRCYLLLYIRANFLPYLYLLSEPP